MVVSISPDRFVPVAEPGLKDLTSALFSTSVQLVYDLIGGQPVCTLLYCFNLQNDT